MSTRNQFPQATRPVSHEVAQPEIAGEQLQAERRIVVFGTNVDGVYDVIDLVKGQLEAMGADDTAVTGTRNFAHMPDVFFGRPRPDAPQPKQAELTSAPAGSASRLGLASLAKFLRRRQDAHEQLPAPVTEVLAPTTPDTLPLGAIILPNMRQYDPTGRGHTIQPASAIIELCETHGVPYRLAMSAADLRESIGQLGAVSSQGLPGADRPAITS